MTWPTHTLFGISTLWLLAPVPPEVLHSIFGVLAAAAALGALLPDLDASESKIKHLKIPNTEYTLQAVYAFGFCYQSKRSTSRVASLFCRAGNGGRICYTSGVLDWLGACGRTALGLLESSHGRRCHQKRCSTALPKSQAISLAAAWVEIHNGFDS